MKLQDILEVNFQNVDVYEPSGQSGRIPVDPDKIAHWDRIKDRDEGDKTGKLRRKFKVIKLLRSPKTIRSRIQGDNVDLTGSGAHSVVNAPHKY